MGLLSWRALITGTCAVLERYYQELLRLISRSTGCRDKAQDVVQEAYARILARKPQGGAHALHSGAPPDSGQRALLYVTAKNIAIDEQRDGAERVGVHPTGDLLARRKRHNDQLAINAAFLDRPQGPKAACADAVIKFHARTTVRK